MKKIIHILAALHGDQDSQAALIRIDETASDSIRHGRRHVCNFQESHGGTPSINHIGSYQIHFLSGIPAGFIDGFDDPEDLSLIYDEEFMEIEDLDEDAFTTAAESAGFYQRSECTGLKIYSDALYIVGLEKHCDERIESQDISGALVLQPLA